MSSPISYDLQGQGGGVVLSTGIGATQIAYKVRWIQCLTDCVFAGFACDNITNLNNAAGPIIPAGVGIGGKDIDVEIASGLAIAYYS